MPKGAGGGVLRQVRSPFGPPGLGVRGSWETGLGILRPPGTRGGSRSGAFNRGPTHREGRTTPPQPGGGHGALLEVQNVLQNGANTKTTNSGSWTSNHQQQGIRGWWLSPGAPGSSCHTIARARSREVPVGSGTRRHAVSPRRSHRGLHGSFPGSGPGTRGHCWERIPRGIRDAGGKEGSTARSKKGAEEVIPAEVTAPKEYEKGRAQRKKCAGLGGSEALRRKAQSKEGAGEDAHTERTESKEVGDCAVPPKECANFWRSGAPPKVSNIS